MNICNLHEELNLVFYDSLDSLEYNSDYELLIKLILSPRASENKVNQIGDLLISEFPNVYDLNNDIGE